MLKFRTWSAFPPNYRTKEIDQISQWIVTGESGSVIGLPGCGLTNLLGYLCHYPEKLNLPPDAVILVPIDLNDLPANTPSTLYRSILRAFYWIRGRFDLDVTEKTAELFQENKAEEDPFLAQSALYELLFGFQTKQVRIVLILNHFDRFCEEADHRTLHTLRGLRDGFKETLCFIVGMSKEVIYLPNYESLGNLYELLDSHICWVGAMENDDAEFVIAQAIGVATSMPERTEVQQMLDLAGNFPILLKSVSQWWLNNYQGQPINQLVSMLFEEKTIKPRLTKLWKSLTHEEQLALSIIQSGQSRQTTVEQNKSAISGSYDDKISKQLEAKGMCLFHKGEWQIKGKLLANYIKQVGEETQGRIRLDQTTHEIYHGRISLKEILSPLEDKLLRFMLTEETYKRHTYTNLINAVWSEDDAGKTGITNNHLHSLVRTLRKKIEVNVSEPRYIVNWKAYPEGMYQLYPEGRPKQDTNSN